MYPGWNIHQRICSWGSRAHQSKARITILLAFLGFKGFCMNHKQYEICSLHKKDAW
uniref:Uncharacterized protein n=1 Tax=Rhizophora mucronata TaxID=61149 RepID=A0A2P2IZZ2_RHIMU